MGSSMRRDSFNFLLCLLLLGGLFNLFSCSKSKNGSGRGSYPGQSSHVFKVSIIPEVNLGNVKNYSISGSCSSEGDFVDVDIEGVVSRSECTNYIWATTSDLEKLIDGDVLINLYHFGEQLNKKITKDTVVPRVTMFWTQSPVIDSSNVSHYSSILQGGCSVDGDLVHIDVGGIKKTVICHNNTWGASLDLTSLPDGRVVTVVSAMDPNGNSGNELLVSLLKDTSGI